MIKADNYPSKVLGEAVEAISSLPGIGSRSALRLTLHILRQDKARIENLASSIARLSTDIHYCSNYNMLQLEQ